MTDEELDALVYDLRTKCPYPAAGNSIVIRPLSEAAAAITTLRAQLAEARAAKATPVVGMDMLARAYNEKTARADKSEAALAEILSADLAEARAKIARILQGGSTGGGTGC